KRKADMLIRIARLTGLNEKTFSHFPRGWSILHQLARIELDELERLTREGFIHPGLTFAEAKKLARRRSRKGQPKRPPVKAWMRKLATFVQTTYDDWSIEQRKLASAKLRDILLHIEAHAGPLVLLGLTEPRNTSSLRFNAIEY